MGPFLDTYALTARRDSETIERFLREYGDRSAMEDMVNSQLITLPVGKHIEDYGLGSATTLTEVIHYGLEYPQQAFTLYLTPVRKRPLDHLILGFTTDDRIVLGFSLLYVQEYDKEGIRASNRVQIGIAKKLLRKLIGDFGCSMGLIGVEHSPPLSATEFHETIRTGQYTLYTWLRAME